MKALRGKNEEHIQRISDFGLKGIMVYWKKQEHRIQHQLKNHEGLNQAVMEEKILTEKKDVVSLDLATSSTTDCMKKMIETN